MYKHFILYGLFQFFATLCIAQSFDINIKGGINVSYFGGMELSYGPRLAYHIGPTVQLPMAPNVHSSVGLIYSLQGAQDRNINSIKANYHYLSLPWAMHIGFYEVFSLDMGVQVAYLFDAVSKNTVIVGGPTSGLNRLDYALSLGTTYRFKPNWSISTQYNYSINPTAKEASDRNGRFPNRVFQCSLIYRIKQVIKKEEPPTTLPEGRE